MKYRYLVLAGALAQAGIANGMGLGNLDLHSYLGSPLQADIELLSPGQFDQNQIRVKIAGTRVYSEMGARFEAFHNDIDFNLERNADGRLMVHMHSQQRVTEPFLDIVVELSWPNGTSYRRYNVLLDPPAYAARIHHQVVPEQAVAPTRTVAVAPESLRLARQAHLAHWYGHKKTTSDLPISDSTYRVRHGDSLWKIARQLRGKSKASLHVIMQQLYADNPDAFVAGNRNRLKLGAHLRLPVIGDVQQQVAHEPVVKTKPAPVVASVATPVSNTKNVDIQNELHQARQAQSVTLPDTVEGIQAAIAKLQAEKQHLQQFQQQTQTKLSRMQQQQALNNASIRASDALQHQLTQAADTQTPVPQPVASSDTVADLIPVKATEKAAAEKAAAPAPVAMPIATAPPAAEVVANVSSASENLPKTAPAQPVETSDTSTVASNSPVADDTSSPHLEVAAGAMGHDLTPKTPALANKLVIGSGPSLWYLLALLPLGFLMVVLGMRSHRVQKIRASEVVKDEDLHDLVFGARRDRNRTESPEEIRRALNQIREKAGTFDQTRSQDGFYHGTDSSEGRDDLKQMIELYLLYSQYQKALNVILTEISKRPARPDLRLYLMQVYASMGDWQSFDEQLAILRAMDNQNLLDEALKMRESLPH